MVYSYVKTAVEHIAHFSNPENREQVYPNRRDEFTHAAFAQALGDVIAAGFVPQPLTLPSLMPTNGFQLQIFEQFSPEAGLAMAKCIAGVAAQYNQRIPVTFVVRTDSETYELVQEAAAFRRILDIYGRDNVTLGVQCDDVLLGMNPTNGMELHRFRASDALGMDVKAISIASKQVHANKWNQENLLHGMINLNHTDFTDKSRAIMQSDAAGGKYGPFSPSIAVAQSEDKPLIWRSATGQWITPTPMTPYEGLFQYGAMRFPTRYYHEMNETGFIPGQPGSMAIKPADQFLYTDATHITPLPKPPALKA